MQCVYDGGGSQVWSDPRGVKGHLADMPLQSLEFRRLRSAVREVLCLFRVNTGYGTGPACQEAAGGNLSGRGIRPRLTKAENGVQ